MESFNDDKIRINVRGQKFKVWKSSLKNIPGSRLTELNYNSRDFDSASNEFYFNRNPILFQSILDFCETGELHIPKSVCSGLVKREFEFWGIDTGSLSQCCWATFYEDIAVCDIYNKLKNDEEMSGYNDHRSESRVSYISKIQKLRRSIWSMFVSPNSSIQGRIYYILILVNVCASIMAFGLTTVESSRIPKPSHLIANESWPNEYMDMFDRTMVLPAINWLDVVTNTFLLIDFLLRLLTSPVGIKYLLNLFNIMEIVVVLFIYITVYFQFYPFKLENVNSFTQYFWIVGYIYVFRIMRIFRLLYHLRGFKVLHISITNNAGELLFFVAIFFSVSCMFAALVFNAEVYGHEPFENFYVGLWWAVITLTSVGYGDTIPNSLQGRILGGAASVCGTLIVAIPMVVIASSYGSVYGCFNTRRMHKSSVEKRKKLTKNGELKIDTF